MSNILWQDSIQTDTAAGPPDVSGGNTTQWGFDFGSPGFFEKPIDSAVTPSDANGSNMTRVANTYGGAQTHMLRVYGRPISPGGSRTQTSISSADKTALQDMINDGELRYFASKWLIPTAFTASGEFLSRMDWHSLGGAPGRWHTHPAYMSQSNGSDGNEDCINGTMKFRHVWNSTSGLPDSSLSSIGYPLNTPFWIQSSFAWRNSSNPFTMETRINNTTVITQNNVFTFATGQDTLEWKCKMYGGSDGSGLLPDPMIHYLFATRILNSFMSQAEIDADLAGGGGATRTRGSLSMR